MNPKYIDTHCHLQFSSYDKDRFDVIERMKGAGVWAIVVGTDEADSAEAAEAISLWSEGIFATVGLHPSETATQVFDEKLYHALVHRERVVGVGECGLDYFRIASTDAEAKRKQKDAFEQQIDFAVEHDLPLMLHIRSSKGSHDAYDDALLMLRAHARAAGEKLRGTSHFFAGSLEVARQFLEMGFMLSFAGPITFARDYDEVIRSAPLDMILPETDSPFAAPAPYRGKRNEPIYVGKVVERIAAVRGGAAEDVAANLVRNAMKLFRIA